jgi:hypothetical protein
MKRTQGIGPRHRGKAHERPDDGNAFLPDRVGDIRPLAGDAESCAEEYLASAVGGDHVSDDARDEVVDDEAGGPFIVLDDDARLPSVPDERDPDRDGHGAVTQEQLVRGALWASRRG